MMSLNLRNMLLLILPGLMLLASPHAATAHVYQGMNTQVHATDEGATGTLQLSAADALLLSPGLDKNKNGMLDHDEFEMGRAIFAMDAGNALHLKSDGEPLRQVRSEVEVLSTEGFSAAPHEVRFTIHYDLPTTAPLGRLSVDPNLFRGMTHSPVTGAVIVGAAKNTLTVLDRGNRATLVATGRETYISPASLTGDTAVASAGAAGAEADQANASSGASFSWLLGHFLWEGILHILMGWDHIFFLLGLLVLAPNLMNLIKVITAFTISHSITLVLAALQMVTIKMPIVEAVVAASVAYVGLENLVLRKRKVQWRWYLVFMFGLVHGLSFADMLKDLLGENLGGAPRLQLISCLLTFNIGVELGQLMILIVLFPMLKWVRSNHPRQAQYVIIGVSCLVFTMGLSFLLDRTFLPGALPWVNWFG